MRTCWLALFIVAFGIGSWAANAADWPQWRGPERSGLSRETGLLRKWPEAGPKLLWQVNDVGNGYSTPAVVGDRIYLLGNEGLENEFVEALAVSDGKKVWSTPIGKVGPNQGPQYPGARSTPTVDGQWLFALGSDGDLVCLETAKGSLRWQKNLRSEFGGKPGAWAYAESPLIDGDVLVCTPGGADATIVALDKTKGNLVWKSAVPEADAAAYASVIVVEADGVKQYVQFLGKGIVGIDAKTGKFLWRYDKTAQGSPANIPTPVAHEGQVYSGTGRGGGGLVKLHADNGQVTAEQVYFNKGLPSSIGGAVLLEGFLYGTNGQSLLCADFATGDIKWQDRCIGPGAVCFADGCLYIHGENGDVALTEATSDGYHELGRFTPPNQPDRKNSKAWAYPVVAGGRLYLRDMGTLWCYDISAAGK
ncbi:MAG TPA: PQQ-binding-like beta-propeller repeat protein [Pirellulales bacterium]|jgi:outer membrane protein assembly factor BamB|nr:PQQ-binding-like beta-propeller repeat protein [Pirellulales bacterium]